MIERINWHRTFDVYDFIMRNKDIYNDFYITIDKNRVFLNNLKLIKKVLKRQEIYIIGNKQIEGLLLIYKEKGYRPYIKILCDNKRAGDLFKYISWNFRDKELFLKVKKQNPINKLCSQSKMFDYFGDRGNEVLFIKRINKKMGETDGHNNYKD
jgi:hypothetical protein